jgi:hypothetical protein
VTLEAQAKQKAAEILADGEKQAVAVREEARNDMLRQKVEILSLAGDAGKTVLFIQQQLPNLFDSFRKHAEGMAVNSLVVMDDDRGFNGAVNRGPAAFADFLLQLQKALGVDVRSFVASKEETR